jgi:hypothetical protein
MSKESIGMTTKTPLNVSHEETSGVIQWIQMELVV